MRQYCTFFSPIGPLTLVQEGDALTQLEFGIVAPQGAKNGSTPLLEEICRQLGEYFEGARSFFDVPVALKGTPFQLEVWRALRSIPFGRTRTYKDIAEQVGKPRASRAVGMANHQNPIPIIIPCHRVIGASGKLTGYAPGLDKKEYLLSMEHVLAQFDK